MTRSSITVNKKPPVVPIALSQSFKRTSKTGVLSKQMVLDASLQTPAKKRTEEKLVKEIKIILVISGHGLCETIKCKENICELTDEEQPACIFDKDKSILHDCGDATSNFHMSVYTEDIKLYSYAHYGHRAWSSTLKLFTDSKGKDLYYNDFSRIYDVNRKIEATVSIKATVTIKELMDKNPFCLEWATQNPSACINNKDFMKTTCPKSCDDYMTANKPKIPAKAAAVPEGPDPLDDYNELMRVVSRDINEPSYGEMVQLNKACLDLEKSVMINFSKKSIVKEIYVFEHDYRSDDPLFTQLKKPTVARGIVNVAGQPSIEEPGWASWFWSVLGYVKYLPAPEITIAPNVIFSGIFVAKTNKPENFGKECQKLLPNEINPNYNCDFTLFSHIYEIGKINLCYLILNYILYWNKYITENKEFRLCEQRINKIKLNYNKENPVLSKITGINNESLYHIVNIILNWNIPGSELIKTLSDSFVELEKMSGDNYISRLKVLLDDICGLFNVELHLISNACRSLESGMPEPGMENKIQTLQNSIHSCMKPPVGGKKTRKRKHRRTKKRRLHKKYI